jgi:adenylosuccinate synthase
MVHAFVVVDLGFGDAGKGTIVDALTRQFNAGLVVRSNGGSQAAHNVVVKGKHHTFSQFGSGTFWPDTKTLLMKHMLVNPLAMQKEADHLQTKGVENALKRVYVDERAWIVTPYHRALNRIRELARGDSRHGSCGCGIGETVADGLETADPITVWDLRNMLLFQEKLRIVKRRLVEHIAKIKDTVKDMDELSLRTWIREFGTFEVDPSSFIDRYETWAKSVKILNFSEVHKLLESEKIVVFEGAQGILIDGSYGFQPYTTFSTTTTYNALETLREFNIETSVARVGVTRSYMVRHGPGPFPTQDDVFGAGLPDNHNAMNAWQREFRIGVLDIPLLEYAIKATGGIDCLAITHLDRMITPRWPVCLSYDREIPFRRNPDYHHQELMTQFLTDCKPKIADIERDNLIPLLEKRLNASTLVTSSGPTELDKYFFRFYRTWA